MYCASSQLPLFRPKEKRLPDLLLPMQAIKWALEKKVDIISMSIAMLDPGRDNVLEKMVNTVKNTGVIIVCSTHDEGTRTPKAYPASQIGGQVIVITACDEHGRLLRDHDQNKFNYKLQGQNVAAGVIPFVESSDYISGSSVSTALAAGLSSLILTCDRLARLREKEPETANEENEPEDKKADQFEYAKGQVDIVTKHLEKMALGNHLLLEKFGKIDSTTKEGDEVYAPKILQDSFHMQI